MPGRWPLEVPFGAFRYEENRSVMTARGHPRAAEVFSRALEMPTEERPRFLKEECGDDAALRAEVESLLEAHRRGGEFLGSEKACRRRNALVWSAVLDGLDEAAPEGDHPRSRRGGAMNLLVGATGVLGGEICRRLRDGGNDVRGLVRSDSPRERELADLGVEIATGDLKDPASLEVACRGVQRVISTATCIASRRRGDTLRSVDHDGQLALVDVARKAGVEHFIFVSLTIADESEGPAARSPFVRYKREVERTVRESGMSWTILRPGPFMETMFSPLAGWNLENGRVRVVGSGRAKASPISLKDVAEFAVAACREPGMRGRCLTLGGPQALSALDAVKVFEDVTGRKLKVQHTPVALLRVASALLRPLHPPISSILALGSGPEVDHVVDMGPVLAEFPIELTTVRKFAEELARG
jgi:uncharacterized protein YbjT (DUF2867 family)